MAQKNGFSEGQAVFARVKVSGTVALIPAVVAIVEIPAEDAPKGTRTQYTLSLVGGTGHPVVNESILIPREEATEEATA